MVYLSSSRVASKYLESVKPDWLDITAETPLDSLLAELSQRTAVIRLQEACQYAQQAEWDAQHQLDGAVRLEEDQDNWKRAGIAAHRALGEAEKVIREGFLDNPEPVAQILRRIRDSMKSLASWGARE